MSHRTGQPRLSHAQCPLRWVLKPSGGNLILMAIAILKSNRLRRFTESSQCLCMPMFVRTVWVKTCPPDMNGHPTDMSGHAHGHNNRRLWLGNAGPMSGGHARTLEQTVVTRGVEPSYGQILFTRGTPRCPDMHVCARGMSHVCARRDGRLPSRPVSHRFDCNFGWKTSAVCRYIHRVRRPHPRRST